MPPYYTRTHNRQRNKPKKCNNNEMITPQLGKNETKNRKEHYESL